MTVIIEPGKNYVRIEKGMNGYIAFIGTGDYGRQSGRDPFFVARSFDDLCEELRGVFHGPGEDSERSREYAPWFTDAAPGVGE